MDPHDGHMAINVSVQLEEMFFGIWSNRVAADTEGDISMDEPLMLKKMQQSVDEDDQGEEV